MRFMIWSLRVGDITAAIYRGKIRWEDEACRQRGSEAESPAAPPN